jgi:cysteine desulfurase
VAEDIALSAVRVSLGWTSTAADIDAFLDGWAALRSRHLARAGAPTA